MILDEMNIAYLKIKEQYKKGLLKENELYDAIDTLRLISADGTLWRIEQSGEGWSYWTGSHWLKGYPADDKTLKPVYEDWQVMTGLIKQPQSALQFLMKFFKALSLNFIKQIPKKVLTTVFVVFVLNAITNYLYYKTYSPLWDKLAKVLQTRTNLLTRFIYYYTMTLIIAAIIKHRQGLVKHIKSSATYVLSEGLTVFEKWSIYLIQITFGLAIALWLGHLIDSRLVELLLIVSFAMAISANQSSSLLLFIRLVQQDVMRLGNKHYRSQGVSGFIWGMMIGLLLAILLGDSYVLYGFYACLLGIIAAIIFTTMQKEGKQ